MSEHNKESVATDEKLEENEQEILDAEDNSDEQVEIIDETPLENDEREIDRIKQEKEEAFERMLRVQAEFDNYKKRTQREKLAERKYKSQELVTELLPAMDNFERALAVEATEETKSIIEGITMVYNQLKAALESQGVEEIETVGKEFDPNLHHAVMQIEDDSMESNIVAEELQKGYILNDRVIRAAMVKVNK